MTAKAHPFMYRASQYPKDQIVQTCCGPLYTYLVYLKTTVKEGSSHAFYTPFLGRVRTSSSVGHIHPSSSTVVDAAPSKGCGSVQVNGKLQTSNPDIYAIGDVAAFPIKNFGLDKLMRQEHVANCRQSAKHAGKNAV